METILALDKQLFLLINHLPHNEFLNVFALTLSGIGTGGLIWFMLGVWLFTREEKKNNKFFIPMLGVGIMSWLLVEIFLKQLFARPRPTVDLGAIVVGGGAEWFSFPSSHAAIAWAMAVVLTHYEPRAKWWFIALAAFISLSRIYLGVHYPFDVLVGGLLGWVMGKWVLRAFTYRSTTKRRSR